MQKSKKVVIIGDSAFAEVAYECFTHDSPYEVVGFSVESAYLTKDTLFGLPVVPYESIESHFTSAEVEFYAALVYSQLNRLRRRLYEAAKRKGYRPASYISTKAFVWPNAVIGEHCFIFEDNTIQPFAQLGNNVVLWSGNHIGHHSVIEDHCFVSSHAVVSGFCRIGAASFIGVNAAVGNNVTIAADNWIGPGVTIIHDTEPAQLFKGNQPEPTKVSTHRFFKLKES
ncbi:sugar O-acyltransferase (sialic acid O-acetyltransferase NeuD family) [Trinickia symbiotica]|uniref:Sugar O-acyltransferase n=1 Tax=Trinickia symbiotica TaxID=863227 RepID=A0A2N7X6X0_9BURK|nr:acetyltransferase [Trinickia symbiotica]PMS37509.1 sugar O-acyltransferase [Trinickia symbiotica]PPK44087.1 sugar O-acyltransferase (sialic acid O-acetyltransferase NeuD family) [Trinickia symbiotica]